MAFTPYSTPIQYEYKPLNLMGFAAPLSEMQKEFDTTASAIDEADVDLLHLDLGKDPEKAKALKELYRSKTEELAKNLYTSKNYRQAASKLKELNRLFQTDPEKLALEANYKARQEYHKAQKERIDKPDGITRDQYYEDIARKDREYVSKEGTNWKNDPNSETGDYNSYGTKARLADLEKEFQEIAFKVASAVSGDKRAGALKEMGIDPELMDKQYSQTIIDERDPKKVQIAVENYLKTLPRFKAQALEVADYKYDALAQNPEALKEKNDALATSALKGIDAQLASLEKSAKKDKTVLESDEYKELVEFKQELEQGKTTGEYDYDLMSSLYKQEHLGNVYNMKALGEVFKYKNVDVNYSWRAIPKEDTGDGGDGSDNSFSSETGYFIPNSEEKWSIDALATNKNNSAKALWGVVGKVNDLVSGNVRAVVMGGDKNSASYKKLLQDPSAIRARQAQLLGAISETLEGGGDWKAFKNKAAQKGLKMEDGRAYTIWKSLTKNGNQGIADFKASMDATEEDANQYINSQKLLNTIQKNVTETQEFKSFANTLGSYVPGDDELGYGSGEVVSTDKKRVENVQKLFNPDSYSKESLNKIGFISGSSFSKAIGTVIKGFTKYLSMDQVAQLHGYKNALDAANKGYDFAGFKPAINAKGELASTNVFWGDDKYTQKTVPQILQEKQGEVYSKGLVANEMSYRFINDKNLDKQMSKFFLSAGDLTSYVPAYSKNWKNVPGFTEEGGLAAGTTLNINENRAPKIVMHGNQMLYEIPITYKKDGVSTETTVTVKPKKGMNVRHDKLLKDLDWASGGGTATEAADKETNTMIKAMRFDNKFQNNNLSPQLIQSIDVAKGQSPVELFSAPFSNTTKLVVYKANTNGTDPSLNIAQVDKNSGKVLGYLNNPKTGKPFYTHADDPEAYVEVKNLIMQALGD